LAEREIFGTRVKFKIIIVCIFLQTGYFSTLIIITTDWIILHLWQPYTNWSWPDVC